MWEEYTGREWLLIDIANNLGFDKKLYKARLNIAEKLLAKGKDVAIQAAAKSQRKGAYLAIKGIEEYFKATEASQKGEVYLSGHRVGQDAGASGLQMLSALTGDIKGARHSGLIGKQRANAYKRLHAIMAKDSDLLDAEESAIKDAIMTFFYGSNAEPKKICGSKEALKVFNTVLNRECQGATMVRNLSLAVYQEENEGLTGLWSVDKPYFDITFPDGFVARSKVFQELQYDVESEVLGNFKYKTSINQASSFGLFLASKIAHGTDSFVARELSSRAKRANKGLIERCIATLEFYGYTFEPKPSSIVPSINNLEEVYRQMDLPRNQRNENYLNSMYAMLNLVQSRPSYDVAVVHDDYTQLANYVSITKKYYREIMAEIADSNLLEDIIFELTGRKVEVEKLSNNLSTEILRGDYAIN